MNWATVEGTQKLFTFKELSTYEMSNYKVALNHGLHLSNSVY